MCLPWGSFFSGHGVERDLGKAKQYLDQACSGGIDISCKTLKLLKMEKSFKEFSTQSENLREEFCKDGDAEFCEK